MEDEQLGQLHEVENRMAINPDPPHRFNFGQELETLVSASDGQEKDASTLSAARCAILHLSVRLSSRASGWKA